MRARGGVYGRAGSHAARAYLCCRLGAQHSFASISRRDLTSLFRSVCCLQSSFIPERCQEPGARWPDRVHPFPHVHMRTVLCTCPHSSHPPSPVCSIRFSKALAQILLDCRPFLFVPSLCTRTTAVLNLPTPRAYTFLYTQIALPG